MTQISIEPEMSRQLNAVKGQAILCDCRGRVLGVFTASGEARNLQLEPPQSAEVLEASRSMRHGKTLRQIHDELGLT